MNKPLYIDIHILQSVPPSNINRDDTGSPKTARFGGVTRARVSSQAWKKAARDLFPNILDEEEVGQRTKHAVELIAEYIRKEDASIDEDVALEFAEKALAATGINVAKGETSYLFFIGPRQASALAELAVQALNEQKDIDRKAAKAILDIKKRPALNAVDIALFGRMVADAPDLNVDASVQVAHAIGVGRVEQEFDYFTALDDRAPEDNAGAAMIDTTEFTSATFYRYANIDVFHLYENLGSSTATEKGVEAFLKAFITSMPTGKQNSFANRTLPAAVVVQLRETQPVSLANAFETPISVRRGESQIAKACEALVEQERALDDAFGIAPLTTYIICGSPDASTICSMADGTSVNLQEMVEDVGKEISAYLESCGCVPEGEER